MRTVTYTKNYYTIDELTGNAREEALRQISDKWSNDIMEIDFYDLLESIKSFLNIFKLSVTDYEVSLFFPSFIYDDVEYYRERESSEINADVQSLNKLLLNTDDCTLTGVYTDFYIFDYFRKNKISKVTYNNIHKHLSNISEFALTEFLKDNEENLTTEKHLKDYAYTYDLEFDEDGEIY